MMGATKIMKLKLCKRICCILTCVSILASSGLFCNRVYALDAGTIIDNADGIVNMADWIWQHGVYAVNGLVSLFNEDICPSSFETNGLHHFVEMDTQVGGVVGSHFVCEYCGKSAGVSFTTAYDNYVESLPADEIDSDGTYSSPMSVYKTAASAGDVMSESSFSIKARAEWPEGYSKESDSGHYEVIASSGGGSASARGDAQYGASVSIDYIGYMPCAGTATVPRQVGGRFDAGSFGHSTKYIEYSTYTFDAAHNIYAGVSHSVSDESSVYLTGTVVCPRFYFTPVVTDDDEVKAFKNQFTYNTRASSVNGDVVVMNGDGNLELHKEVQIIDEQNNTFYDLGTGNTFNLTSWSYNYPSRRYDFSYSGGSGSVIYGDNAISVNNGSTTSYYYYYIGDGDDGDVFPVSDTSCPSSDLLFEGGTHNGSSGSSDGERLVNLYDDSFWYNYDTTISCDGSTVTYELGDYYAFFFSLNSAPTILASFYSSGANSLEPLSGCYIIRSDSAFVLEFPYMGDGAYLFESTFSGFVSGTMSERILITSVAESMLHNYVFSSYVDPTCTSDGAYVYRCSQCGDEISVAVHALGHKYNSGVVTTPSTCVEDGVYTFTCTRCGDTYTTLIPALGHDWDSETQTDTVYDEDGDLVTHGYITYHCARCNETYTEEHDTEIVFSGFWPWFRFQWEHFRAWYSGLVDQLAQRIGGSSGGSSTVVNFDNSVDVDTGDISLSYSVTEGSNGGFKLLNMILRLFGDIFGNLDGAVESVVSSPYTESVVDNGDGTSSTVRTVNEDSALSIFFIPIE